MAYVGHPATSTSSEVQPMNSASNYPMGSVRYTKFCRVGKHNSTYYDETVELSNPGPTQPKKIRLKAAFGPLFPTANSFSWVRIGFIWETDYNKPNPIKFSANYPIPLSRAVPNEEKYHDS